MVGVLRDFRELQESAVLDVSTNLNTSLNTRTTKSYLCYNSNTSLMIICTDECC